MTRLGWIDTARGLAIVAVVWIHVRSGASYAETPTSWNFDYWVVLRQVLDFPVALFIFLSGYVVNPQRINPTKSWIYKRFVRLFLPFIIWSAIYGTIAIVKIGNDEPVKFAAKVLLGLTAPHLYFVIVLIQLVIITPFLLKITRSRWWWVPLLITPSWIVVRWVGVAISGESLPMMAYFFTSWLVFYYFGLLARDRRAPRFWMSLSVALVAVVLSVLEAYATLGAGWPLSLAVTQIKLSSMFYALAVICIVWVVRFEVGWISKLGLNSYGVYYVHLVWVMILEPILRSTPLDAVLPILHVLQVSLAIFASVGTMWILRNVLGHARAKKFLGF